MVSLAKGPPEEKCEEAKGDVPTLRIWPIPKENHVRCEPSEELLPICLVFVALLSLTVTAEPKSPPKRAMILVFDQMRAEYIDRFDMTNFKRAQAIGTDIRERYRGAP